MTGEEKRHTLADWLALHEIDPPFCRHILRAAAEEAAGAPNDQAEPVREEPALDPERAWHSVVEAMCNCLPAQRRFIEESFEKISRKPVSSANPARRALTLDNGSTSYPTIIYTDRGKSSDMLLMAHEFAHALQIVASGGKFVPPVAREVCAFIGEAALLSRLRQTDDIRYAGLRQVWRRDDRKYLISDGRDLESALDNPDSAYRYNWNYPIARHLANRTCGAHDPQRAWGIFQGSLSVRQIFDSLQD